MEEKIIHAHWIHPQKEDPSSISGIIYLPQCKCSNCNKEVSFERPKCPYCGAIMDEE